MEFADVAEVDLIHRLRKRPHSGVKDPHCASLIRGLIRTIEEPSQLCGVGSTVGNRPRRGFGAAREARVGRHRIVGQGGRQRLCAHRH
jgi:hypothetical protein